MSSDLQGATTMPPENSWPATNGEFAALWNASTEAQRAEMVRRRIDDSERALACIVEQHIGWQPIQGLLQARIDRTYWSADAKLLRHVTDDIQKLTITPKEGVTQ